MVFDNAQINDSQNLDFFFFGPARADNEERTDVTLVREQDFKGLASFQQKVEEEIGASATTPKIIFCVVSSDTLHNARSYTGYGDFVSNLGLGLRGPRLERYHSSYHTGGRAGVLDIRYDAGTSNQRERQFYKPAANTLACPSSFERRSNMVYFRYDFEKKRTICLLSERCMRSGFLPERDRATIETIKSLENASKQGHLTIHPFCVHFVVMYYMTKWRDLPLNRSSEGLFNTESKLLDGSLIEKTAIEGFQKHLQELHETSRTFITLQHSNERDLSLIGKIIAELDNFADKMSMFHEQPVYTASSETRIREAFKSLESSCEERRRKLKNRSRRTQNLTELVYNLIAARNGLASLDVARHNALMARETKRDSEAMKTISFLTMLYLPASLVCSLFGSNFFTFHAPDGSHPQIQVSTDIWILFLVTVLLSAITFFTWLLWQRKISAR